MSIRALAAPGRNHREGIRSRPVRMSGRTTRRRPLAAACAVVVFLCSVFPVYWMVNTSLQANKDIVSGTPMLFPANPTLRAYAGILGEEARPDRGNFGSALLVSLGVTVIALIVCLLFAFLGALALSRFAFRGRKGFVIGLLVVQMIPAEAMMFTVFSMVDGWRLLNSILGLSIVYLAAVLPFTLWTLRGFVAGIPAELEEAAQIDGCSRTQAFWKVTFPLLAPGLASTSIFAFIQAWNEFTMANILMQKPDSYTLPIWLRTFQQATQSTDWASIMAGSALLAVPVMIFFLIVQGKMAGGLVGGAVKG